MNATRTERQPTWDTVGQHWHILDGDEADYLLKIGLRLKIVLEQQPVFEAFRQVKHSGEVPREVPVAEASSLLRRMRSASGTGAVAKREARCHRWCSHIPLDPRSLRVVGAEGGLRDG